jgi:putative MATE family efflux protein
MKKRDLTQGSILSHIKVIAIPSSIGFLFNTLFNVVDTFWAGRLSTEALAGLTLSFPIFFIIIAISSGFGNGLTALLSNALGKKDHQLFHDFIYNGLMLGVITGLLFIVIMPFSIRPLFELSGASGQSLEYGLDYTTTVFIGAIFFILNFSFNAVLSSQGNTKPFRNYLVAGFFLNLILDPLLIFGWFGLPELGTIGVALATIIVQAFGSIYLFLEVLKSDVFDTKLMKFERTSFGKMLQLLKQGLPASLNLATIALGTFIINYYVLQYGGASGVAAYGASLRIQQLALLPTLGLNIAIITIVGQNFGAKRFDRMEETLKLSLKIGVIIILVGSAIIFFLAPLLIRLFNDDPNVIEIGVTYLRIDLIGFVTYVIINNYTAFLQGIKQPTVSLVIAMLRQTLPLLIFPLFAITFSLGLNGIWWGIVLINWMATLMLVSIAIPIIASVKKKSTV